MFIGDRLRELRKGKFSQEELAEKLHVHNNTISKWEKGTQEPRLSSIQEIAKLFGVSSSYLTGESNTPKENNITKINASDMAYWGEIINNVRAVAEQGNLGEITLIKGVLKSANEILTQGEQRVLQYISSNVPEAPASVDIHHNDMSRASLSF